MLELLDFLAQDEVRSYFGSHSVAVNSTASLKPLINLTFKVGFVQNHDACADGNWTALVDDLYEKVDSDKYRLNEVIEFVLDGYSDNGVK